MGIHACALTAIAVAAGWMPTIAGADGFGDPCGSISPGAILPLPVHFNATTGSPYTPRMAEFTDSEPLPLSNFGATANWGDGTTTPATIGPEGCHQVTAPGHVYAHSGAYPFSYTVHDTHTGLDHEIGAETVYIWGVPQRVDPPSSHVIDATVGVPWSGILGEFTEEQPPRRASRHNYVVRPVFRTGKVDPMSMMESTMPEPQQLRVNVRLEDGSLWATVEEYPGVFATGDNLDELRESLQEGIP